MTREQAVGLCNLGVRDISFIEEYCLDKGKSREDTKKFLIIISNFPLANLYVNCYNIAEKHILIKYEIIVLLNKDKQILRYY